MATATRSPKAGRISRARRNLICVAHPDDETIFFGGLLLQRRSHPWTVVCATDANADGEGKKRRRDFERACKTLGAAQTVWLGFPDVYEKRLNVAAIGARLEEFSDAHEIFTHGIIGEYGHPHHQDVSYAAHHAFRDHPRLFASAYNTLPELKIQLSASEFEIKSRVLAKTYGSETRRFLNLLPSTPVEGFLRLDIREVEAVYDYLAHGCSLRTRDLKAYRWLVDFLREHREMPRPF